MEQTRVRFRLEHQGGASDEVYETYASNIPRVGEYVTINPTKLVHQHVFDVNWEYGEFEELVTVWLTCRGNNEYCDWDCDSDRR